VDSTREACTPIGGFLPSPDQRWKGDSWSFEQLSELPVTGGKEVPAQFKASLSHGYFFPLIVVNAFTHTSHSLSLRLYRPGYELVEIKPWERIDRVVWRPAADVEAQVRSLEQLLAGTTEDRNVLLFGASEYERLARTTPSREQQRGLCRKARDLRELANK
jgi:hypothetical protein